MNEAKKKAESLPGNVLNKLPGGLGKRILDQANEDPEDKPATRGMLDKVKNKVTQVEKTAEEYKNKAKGITTKSIEYFDLFL